MVKKQIIFYPFLRSNYTLPQEEGKQQQYIFAQQLVGTQKWGSSRGRFLIDSMRMY